MTTVPTLALGVLVRLFDLGLETRVLDLGHRLGDLLALDVGHDDLLALAEQEEGRDRADHDEKREQDPQPGERALRGAAASDARFGSCAITTPSGTVGLKSRAT